MDFRAHRNSPRVRAEWFSWEIDSEENGQRYNKVIEDLATTIMFFKALTEQLEAELATEKIGLPYTSRGMSFLDKQHISDKVRSLKHQVRE